RTTIGEVEKNDLDESALMAFSLALDQAQIAIADRRAQLAGHASSPAGDEARKEAEVGSPSEAEITPLGLGIRWPRRPPRVAVPFRAGLRPFIRYNPPSRGLRRDFSSCLPAFGGIHEVVAQLSDRCPADIAARGTRAAFGAGRWCEAERR